MCNCSGPLSVFLCAVVQNLFLYFYAQLFRKDLISAMKLADNQPLTEEDYWGILDPWKQEWEKGVQVPVNPDLLPIPSVTTYVEDIGRDVSDFRL